MRKRLFNAFLGISMAVGILFLLQMLLIPFVQHEIQLSFKQDQVSDDPFTLGQYYFNHDDDPGGPYDLKKARTYYEQVILAAPDRNGQVWHQLGRIDFLEGDFESALYKFNKQIEYFGDTVPNVYYMIGLTYAYKARETGNSEDWAQASAAFKEYLTYDPYSPWARTDLSWIYFAEGKYLEMIPILRVGLKHNPEHPWLLNMYGLALRGIGSETEAAEYFRQAKEFADTITVEEWGRAYPGNNPKYWAAGLDEFQSVVNFNESLTQ